MHLLSSQVTEHEECVFQQNGAVVEETNNRAKKTNHLPSSCDEHKDLKQDIRDTSGESFDANSDQIESTGVICESAGINSDQVSGVNNEQTSDSTGTSVDHESSDVNSDQASASTGVNNDQVSGVNSDQKSSGADANTDDTSTNEPDASNDMLI